MTPHIEYLRLIFAWPFVVGIIAVVGCCMFKQDIRLLMSRIAKIRFPGGSELSTSQSERPPERVPDQTPPIPPEDANLPVPLPQGLHLNQEQMEAVRHLYLSERANAYLWEYRYLNLFLALHTQHILDWFGNSPTPIARSLYDNVWMPLIPSAEERATVINVLAMHHLLQIRGELISITPKGQEYREWRGPMPALNESAGVRAIAN